MSALLLARSDQQSQQRLDMRWLIVSTLVPDRTKSTSCLRGAG
jgi:hypothetical protein